MKTFSRSFASIERFSFGTLILFLGFQLSFSEANAQRGIKGNVTISTANTIVNEYTRLTANAVSGSTSITVLDNTLDSVAARFTTPLAAGDLIFIYQAQGATINGTLSGGIGIPNDATWGGVTNYGSSGNYELAEVASVSGGTIINLTCGLRNDYTTAGRTQVIRVPRYENLIINAGSGIIPHAWNGTIGGIVVVEVNTATTINGTINANGRGFRGGALDPNSQFNPNFTTILDIDGAIKGESIAGYQTDLTPNGGMYCMAAPANGGGGGNAHNAGGGGGANGGDILLWDGRGNPSITTASWANAWNLEAPGFSTHTSSGGGRGGYSWSNSNQNATTLAPGSAAWGGDNRKIYGGYGGRPLDYSTGKIFFGGGGGAGDQNENFGGAGGNGGGIIFLYSHGTVGGTGTITANGNNGNSTLIPAPGFGQCTGKDGAGGAGGGGCVIINSNGSIAGISIVANGGNGGNQNLSCNTFTPAGDAYGTGAGGGGGYIAISNGAISRTTNGGDNGTCNAPAMTEFPPNGATRGGAGVNNASIANHFLTVNPANINICASATATLTATLTGALPSGASINWYDSQFGNTIIGTGLTFTTPVLTSTTTYYVGICPGFYRIPVTVTVGSTPVIDISNMLITNATCGNNNGAINNIIVTGATSYTWNGVNSATPDLSNAAPGSYTLIASGGGSCTATAGPFTISTGGGPVINTASMVITPTSCGINNGSITGITATGTAPLSYTWNGAANNDADTNQLAAGSYTLLVTDGLGCSAASGPHAIAASTAMSFNSSGIVITPATCGSTNGSITGIILNGGSAPISLQWNGTPAATTDISGIGSGNYTITATDNAGCTASSGPFTVTSTGGASINDANIVIVHTSCGNNNGSISGILVSGGTSPYTFAYNATNNPTADISNLTAGSYTFSVTDDQGCVTASGPYVINPSSSPTVNVTGSNVSCFGANDGTATASGSGGTGILNYQWTSGPAGAVFAGTGAGTFSVTVTDAAGCTATGSVTLTEPAEIIAAISGTNSICNGQNTTLTASGGTSYSWSSGDNTAATTVTPTITTTYTVTVTVGSCSTTSSVTVTVNDVPVASISGTTSVCPGQSTTLTASGGSTYLWSSGETTPSITISPTANGPLSVTATNGCGSDNETVNLIVFPAASASAGADVTIALGGSTTLSASAGTSYSWLPSTGLNQTNTQSVIASPGSTTTYIVTITDSNGCTASDDVIVSIDMQMVVFVPDAFSPNGDGNNDQLFVRGAGIREFTFRVYDRWGEKVFESTDLQSGWDGNYKGSLLNSGVFVYTLEGEFISGEKFDQKGNVTLFR
ncbi:MAG TPA: gliding motility-associated C-terminal domain-containing protein [Flavobacteriales bacterium]|nr:gliding motility-associated C-terminal domain-containing protein [Flavobacteriales bacterium]HRJ34999.1 gliding motility-associated C-terminal domain-containing protein [Flavobacteriales bacterium]HRJ39669.1 gliding motility-associated C-terminal domain-containing protein [Flavobacteriales bacterium]